MIASFPDQIIEVIGKSLGGSMAYHTAAHYPQHVEIRAYMPAGLHARNFTLPEGQQIRGKIYMADSDIVSMLGQHPEGTELYRVVRSETPNAWLAHMRCFGGEETLLLRVNAVWENQRTIRTVLGILHAIFSPLISFVCVVYLALRALCLQITALFYCLFCPAPAQLIRS